MSPIAHRDIFIRILSCDIPAYEEDLHVGDDGSFTFCIKSRSLRYSDLDRLSDEFGTKEIDFGAPTTDSYMPGKGFHVTVRKPQHPKEYL